MKKGLRRAIGVSIGVVILAVLIGSCAVTNQIKPVQPVGDDQFIRLDRGVGLLTALERLEREGIIRNATSMYIYARVTGRERYVGAGTYKLHAGMDPNSVLDALQEELVLRVRLPEGWWIARTATVLERDGVANAEEYIELANNPDHFRDKVEFPLPEESLEGYLYPDTYEFAPEMGAEAVILAQLQAFNEKVYSKYSDVDTLHRAIIVASMVELEAGVDEERPMIAGVIENRLRIGQRLELDATVLYAEQEWRVLGPGEVRQVQSPYNTYLNSGLPPGPIGSPSLRSIEAAFAPASHNYFFYVAKPDRTHYFSTTYDEHRANIRKSRAEFAEQRAAEGQ